jgi:alginate O-acetyltransferase complex protein AlgI
MPFNSYGFIFLFFPIVLAVYYAWLHADKPAWARLWLLAASIFCYGWWKPENILLLLLSAGVNYGLYQKLLAAQRAASGGEGRRSRKKSKGEQRIFRLALIFNVAFLAFFKYTNFLIGTLNDLTGAGIGFIKIALPLGVSFFTIQQIIFQFHAYEGTVKQSKFTDYLLFVSFFGYLTAGPIVHYKEVVPQLDDEKRQRFSFESFYAGLWLFVIGLFKKAFVADTFAVWANSGYAHAGDLTFFAAWATVISYSMQLYFDFSGYSDMAIGIGRMLNFELPRNFDSPFKATNLIGFWSRWHMTLTRFIATYLYVPISRAMPQSTFGFMMLATFISMFIAGLWHGAAWTFVIFGSIHGLGLVINNVSRKMKLKVPPALGWLLTMGLVVNANTFFRADSVGQALTMLKGMYFGHGISFSRFQFVDVAGVFAVDTFIMVTALITAIGAVLLLKNSDQMMKSFKPSMRMAVALPVLFWIAVAHFSDRTDFVYFNF